MNPFDTTEPPTPQHPRLPHARTFIVRRYNPVTDDPQVEEITIHAHTVQVNGDTLEAISIVGVQDGEPVFHIQRAFNGFLDYEEVLPTGVIGVRH